MTEPTTVYTIGSEAPQTTTDAAVAAAASRAGRRVTAEVRR